MVAVLTDKIFEKIKHRRKQHIFVPFVQKFINNVSPGKGTKAVTFIKWGFSRFSMSLFNVSFTYVSDTILYAKIFVFMYFREFSTLGKTLILFPVM